MKSVKKNGYQKKFIAFIDILGFAELVRKSGSEYGIKNELHKSLMILFGSSSTALRLGGEEGLVVPNILYLWKKEKSQRSVENFSDTLILTCLAEPEEFELLVGVIAKIQVMLAIKKIFLRGAVTVGEVYIGDGLLYGPGIVEAYKLESTSAIFPRIIIDTRMVEDILCEEKLTDIVQKQSLLQDYDGKVFINFLHDDYLSLGWIEERLQEPCQKIMDLDLGGSERKLEKIEENIKEAFCESKANKKLSVTEKYRWLLSTYFNSKNQNEKYLFPKNQYNSNDATF